MSKKFKRQGHKAWNKIGDAWRRPRGRQSKQRRKKKSKLKMPNIGYGTPDKEKPVLVRNIHDLEKVKGKVIISSRLGLKKLLQIAKIAEQKDVEIINKKRIQKAKKKANFLKDRKKEAKKERKKKGKTKQKKTKQKKNQAKKREKKNVKENKTKTKGG